MGCCNSSDTGNGTGVKTNGKLYQDGSNKDGKNNNSGTTLQVASNADGKASTPTTTITVTSTLGREHSGSAHGGATSPKKNADAANNIKDKKNGNDENSDDEDIDSDRASVSSRKSVTSVTSTRSTKAIAISGTSIPKSQDALLNMARTKSAGQEGSFSPQTKGLGKPGGLQSSTSGETRDTNLSPTNYLSEATLEAAKNEMNQFIYGDYSVDPLDAIEQRNARFLGGTAQGNGANSNAHRGSANRGKHIAGQNIASTAGGLVFVLNDFVIRTMDEEMLDAADFKASVRQKKEEFYGDRPLRNSKCRCILGHGARVKAIAVAPDEETFVSSSVEDNDILQQFVSGSGELFYFTGHGAAIVSLSFSRDGHYFASTSRDASIAVWDSQQGTVHKRVRWLDADCGGGGSIPIANAFSCNGQYICAGYQDRVCRVWDLDKNNVVTHFTEHEGIVICVSCHPTELLCASGGADRMVFLWHLETGAVSQRCAGHDNAVISVNFTPNGESLISSDDKSCRIWNVHTGQTTLNVNVSSIVPSLPISNQNTISHEKEKDKDKSQASLGRDTASNDKNNHNNIETSLPGATHASGTNSGSQSLSGTNKFGSTATKDLARQVRVSNYLAKLPESLRQALNGRNSLATAKKAFQSTAAISQRIAFTVSCPCPGQFSTGYFAVASTAKSVHIISMTTGREETSFAAKAPVFALTCGREDVLMFGDTFGNLYVADLK